MSVRADLEEVAAALWDFDSRSNLEIGVDVKGEVEAECENMNEQGFFKATVKRRQKLESKRFTQSRDFVFRGKTQMHRVDAGTIVLLTTPVRTAKVKAKRGSIINRIRTLSTRRGGDDDFQGSEKVAVRLRRTKQGLTKLDLAVELDFGGGVSKDARLAAVKRRLNEAGEVSIYFQRLVPLEGLAEEDGAALANDLLFDSSSAKQRLERLPEVMRRNSALAELKATYEAFEPLMRQFLSGSLGLSRAVGTKLVCVSEKEGKQLGKNGVLAVKSKKKAEAGVDQWKRQVSWNALASLVLIRRF